MTAGGLCQPADNFGAVLAVADSAHVMRFGFGPARGACDMPMHPSRGFTGRARVRDNYPAIFAREPDLRGTVLRSCQDESGVWSEWAMLGTSDEGIPSVSTGVVIILSTVDERIAHTRFYLDAVS